MVGRAATSVASQALDKHSFGQTRLAKYVWTNNAWTKIHLDKTNTKATHEAKETHEASFFPKNSNSPLHVDDPDPGAVAAESTKSTITKRAKETHEARFFPKNSNSPLY